MGWKDWGRKLLGAVADTTVDLTASAFGVCGSVACAAGGVGFAVAEGMRKTFRGSYDVSAASVGGLDIVAGFEGTHLDINYTLPFHVKNLQSSNEGFYKLSNYVDPLTVYVVSGALWGSGIVLKALGSSLKKLQQYRYEVREQIEHEYLARPSRQEYLTGIKGSILDSLSTGLFSYAIANSLVYSDVFGENLGLTYPLSGGQAANSTYYNGPLTSEVVNFHIPFDPQKIPINVPVLGEIDILANLTAKGLVNVTGGAGLHFFKNAATTVPPGLLTAGAVAAGLSAYVSSSVFSKKEKRLYEERLFRERIAVPLIGNDGLRTGYCSINMNC